MLIVIVILGVLSTVTVFAVSGISSRGESASTAADEQILSRAQETYYAQNGTYASEEDLVTAGFLVKESTAHDVELGTGNTSYTIVAQGATTTTLAPPWPDGQVDDVVFQGMNAEQYGNGPLVSVLISDESSGGGSNVDVDWDEFTTTEPAIPGMTMYYVEDPALDTLAELDLLLDNSDFQLVTGNVSIEGQFISQYTRDHLDLGWLAPEYDMSTAWLWRYAAGSSLTDFRTYLTDSFENGAPIGEQIEYAGFDAWTFTDGNLADLVMVSIGTPSTRAEYEDWLIQTSIDGDIQFDRLPLYIEDADITSLADIHTIVQTSPVPVLMSDEWYADYAATYSTDLSEFGRYSALEFGFQYVSP